MPPGELAQARGELRLGEPARLPTAPGLYLRGRLAQVEAAAWQKGLVGRAERARRRHQRIVAERAAGGGAATGPPAGGLRLDDLRLDLRPADAGWRLRQTVRSSRGWVSVPAARAAPLQVDLQALRLPARESAEDRRAAKLPGSRRSIRWPASICVRCRPWT